MREFPALHIFGFTAWQPDTDIGIAIENLRSKQWDRFAVRFSDRPNEDCGASVITNEQSKIWNGNGVLCLAEIGKASCCGSCGYCWGSKKPVTFIEH